MGEPPVGIEPTTPALPWRCSATELRGQCGSSEQQRDKHSQPWGHRGERGASLPSSDAHPPGETLGRRTDPGHLQRRGHRIDRHLRPRAPDTRGAAGLDGRAPRARIRPSWPSTTATPSSDSAPSRRSGTARPTPPPSRTRSTSTPPAGGPDVGRALLEELVVLASQHGFHTVIARVGGGQPGLDRPPPGLRFPDGRRGAGGRAGSSTAGWTSRCSSACSERIALGSPVSTVPVRVGAAGTVRAGSTRTQAAGAGAGARSASAAAETDGVAPGAVRSQVARGTVSTTRIHSRVRTISSGIAVDEAVDQLGPPGQLDEGGDHGEADDQRAEPAEGHRGQEDEAPREVPGLHHRAEADEHQQGDAQRLQGADPVAVQQQPDAGDRRRPAARGTGSP